MKARVLIAALVVVSMLPIAAAQVSDSTQSSADATTASGSAAGSGIASAAGADDSEPNYTRLFIDAQNSYLELQPGESETVTVTVKNGEDEAVIVNPHLYVSPVAEYPLNESWVTIEGATTVEAGAETEYTVEVRVPESAETRRYSGMVAFTDETVSYPGRPAQPVHAEHVSVDVWEEPTVRILSETYRHTQVEAGDSVTHQILIENTGDSAVPLNPELANRRGHCQGSGCPNELDPAWLEIDAPSSVAPGETATVTVTVSPSGDADRGRYDAEIDLGLKDPARDERDTYWQQVRMNFVVWKQPAEPFERTFDVSEEAENVTLTLSPRTARQAAEDAPDPSFDVQFVRPDGETVDAERVRLADNGFVDLSGQQQSAAQADRDYVVRDGGQRFTYRVDDPQAGEWTLRVMPHNTIGFSYETVRDESADA